MTAVAVGHRAPRSHREAPGGITGECSVAWAARAGIHAAPGAAGARPAGREHPLRRFRCDDPGGGRGEDLTLDSAGVMPCS
jgi:hypothetical protein